MRRSLVVTSLLGLFVLTACTQPTQLVAGATPAAGAANVCALSNTEGNTCVRRPNGKRVCHLYVGVTTGGKPYVYPHVLNVARGTASDRPRTLVWHLVDQRLEFTSQDGPIELKSNPEFEDGAPTDDADGDPDSTPGSKRKFRITFKNNQQVPHDYRIAFRSGGTVLTCDPRITNNAD